MVGHKLDGLPDGWRVIHSVPVGVPVHADLVIVGATLTVKSKPSDVQVVYREQVTRWLKGPPAVLDAAKVAHVFDVARRDVTWTSTKR